MNSDHHQRLEKQIDRELKALPELSAPETLAARVMARVERKSALPWYRQAWPAWPLPAQIVSLMMMLVLFGGICFAAWRLSQGAEAGLAAQKLNGWLASLALVWNTVGAILGATILAVKKLGNGVLIACLAIILCNYFACVGLGTVAVRFTLARLRRNQSQL